MRHIRLAAACLCLVGPAALDAQQPTRRQVDSLTAELRALRARFDSLVTDLQRRRSATDSAVRRDTAAVQAELEAVRAAALAASGSPDTTTARRAGGDRNLNQLNPEISVTGDIRAYGNEGSQTANFEAREVELSFQSALDPFSHTKIFVAVEEEGIDIEELYAYWTGLPGRVRLDVGKVRQQLGELNRWHLHALPESEYPLALRTYTGEEGLAAVGLSLYRAFALAGTQEVWAQITQGSNDVLFDGGTAPALLAHLNNFWQLSPAWYAQAGGTVVLGSNPDVDLHTTLWGADVRLTWRPPARAQFREWTLRGELYSLKKELGNAGNWRLGGYVGTTYRLGRSWIAGVSADYVEAPEGPADIRRQIVPSITWWQSEWVFLRAEWRYLQAAGTATNQLALQLVWSIGPHKHETY